MKQVFFLLVTAMVVGCSNGESTKGVGNSETTEMNDNSSGTASTQKSGSASDAGQSLIATESVLTSTESEFEIMVNLSSDVLFDFDRYEIKPEADRELMNLYKLVSEKGKGNIRIIGHTDDKGEDDYNMTLSLKRAEAVAEWLKKKGPGPSVTFTTEGLGSKQPIAQNSKPDGSDDPEGRQKNRRVEIVIEKKSSISK